MMGDICKICYSGEEDNTPLIKPCLCKGSVKYVHQHCLQQWITVSAKKNCGLCKYGFEIESKVKPIHKWEMPDMSTVEKVYAIATLMGVALPAFCITPLLILNADEAICASDLMEIFNFSTHLVQVVVGYLYPQSPFNRWKAHNSIMVVLEVPKGQNLKSKQDVVRGVK